MFRRQKQDLISGGFEFRGNDIGYFRRGYSKRDQCGRYIQVLKSSAHGVLAADGRNLKSHLGFKCSQKSGEWLAPALAVFAKPFKILLEGQVHIFEFTAAGNQLADGL